MIATHKIQEITFEKDMISLKVDGKLIRILLDKISLKLKRANEMQRNFYKISPSGYGIHWPLIDEDLSINAIRNVIMQLNFSKKSKNDIYLLILSLKS